MCLLLSITYLKGGDLEEGLYWSLKTISLSDRFNFLSIKFHAQVVLSEIFYKMNLKVKALGLITSTLPFLKASQPIHVVVS